MTGLPYELVPSTPARASSHSGLRAINPNGKVPAIVDTRTRRRQTRVFDSGAILLESRSKRPGRFNSGTPVDLPELLSWLFFSSLLVLAPFSGQCGGLSSVGRPEKLPMR